MENPTRTADYHARRDARIASLKTTLATLLQGKSSITLEIGCGHGHFLTAYGDRHPNAFCVGIDIIVERIARSDRKRERAELANVVFLHAEAEEFLQALPVDVTFADIFILFPDPWPKRRHHKNRLMQPEFLTALAAKAAANARLCFRTDHTSYYKEAVAVVGTHPRWKAAPEALWPFEIETVFQSRAPSYQSFIALKKTAL